MLGTLACAVRTIQDESPLFIAPRLNGAYNAPTLAAGSNRGNLRGTIKAD
jgi:hypothetical protein